MYRHFLPFSLLLLLSRVSASPYCSLTPPRSSVAQLAQGSGTSISANASDDVVASAWYPGWLGTDFPPQNVSWSKYNHMTYAFAVTTPDVSTLSLAGSNEPLLPQFVELAHQNDVKALVSIGGWTGSQYFSTAVATAENRTAFVQTVLSLVSQYQLDGVDFDWEYPNKQGIGCNTINSDDSANYLLFLQELRGEPAGQNLTISAAVSITPFMGPTGTPLTDVSEYAKVIDYLEIMVYDIWGSWSPSVGPNAPLNDSCATTQDGSAVSAVKAWTSANFPANQITLGVAAYGHSFHVDPSAAVDSSGALVAYPPFDKALQPSGDKWDGAAGTDQCGNPVPVGGIFDYWGLIAGGFLNTDGTTASGIDYRYDNCSQTPFVYNPTSDVMVSYDDATSFAAKGRFINGAGLKGFSMWHVAGDFNDILLDSISGAIGIVQDCS